MDFNPESEALIKKETLYPGTKNIDFKPGTKVKFHYRTIKCDKQNTIIDDSKTIGKPMELVLGKKFKLEVWEVIVQKMSLNEVAKFTVHKTLVSQYPFVSKVIRDQYKPAEERKHCCGMTIQNEGIGYSDLDDLFNNPVDLQFIIELISAQDSTEYEKESWQLSDNEKLGAVDELRLKGNLAFKEKNYCEAENYYIKALGMMELLMLKEKPHDTEWDELAKLKIPLLLNFSQCKLFEKDYYKVIEHCTEVIKLDPDNVKAYYRRAKAHVGAWNPNDAKSDFAKAKELDRSLVNAITKEIKSLEDEIKLRDVEDKLMFQKIF